MKCPLCQEEITLDEVKDGKCNLSRIDDMPKGELTHKACLEHEQEEIA